MNATLQVSPGDVAHRPTKSPDRVDFGQHAPAPPAPAGIVEQYDPPPAVVELVAEVRVEPSPPPPDLPPAPVGPRPSIAELARHALRQADVGAQLFVDHLHALEESERLECESGVACDQATDSRLELARRVLELAGVGAVTTDEWSFGSRPIATVMDGPMLLVVAPADRDHNIDGMTGPALAPFCSLAIIEDVHAAVETPEQARRLDQWAAARGKRWTADGRGLEPIEAEPITAPAPTVEPPPEVQEEDEEEQLMDLDALAQQSLHDAIDRFERARGLAEAAWEHPADTRENMRLLNVALFDACQMEQALGYAIQAACRDNHETSQPGYYQRPHGITRGRISYVLRRDPSDGCDIGGELIARVELGRLVDLDDIRA